MPHLSHHQLKEEKTEEPVLKYRCLSFPSPFILTHIRLCGVVVRKMTPPQPVSLLLLLLLQSPLLMIVHVHGGAR